jgi:hypothetical protein
MGMQRDNEYREMIESLYNYYDKVDGMTEEEACEYMATSTKEEGLRMILGFIKSYRKR